MKLHGWGNDQAYICSDKVMDVATCVVTKLVTNVSSNIKNSDQCYVQSGQPHV